MPFFKAFYGISTYCFNARATPFSAFASIAAGCIHFLFRKSKSITKIDRTLRIAYPILFIGIIVLSVYNAYVTRVIHYEITLDKPIKPLRIGIAKRPPT